MSVDTTTRTPLLLFLLFGLFLLRAAAGMSLSQCPASSALHLKGATHFAEHRLFIAGFFPAAK